MKLLVLTMWKAVSEMKCKNKEIAVNGMEYNDLTKKLTMRKFICICTNDEKGKTLSIDNGAIQFSIPFEAIAECFKCDYRIKKKGE